MPSSNQAWIVISILIKFGNIHTVDLNAISFCSKYHFDQNLIWPSAEIPMIAHGIFCLNLTQTSSACTTSSHFWLKLNFNGTKIIFWRESLSRKCKMLQISFWPKSNFDLLLSCLWLPMEIFVSIWPKCPQLSPKVVIFDLNWLSVIQKSLFWRESLSRKCKMLQISFWSPTELPMIAHGNFCFNLT